MRVDTDTDTDSQSEEEMKKKKKIIYMISGKTFMNELTLTLFSLLSRYTLHTRVDKLEILCKDTQLFPFPRIRGNMY